MLTASIIIPNFNGVTLLKKNLPRVLEACRNNVSFHELIIVDDGSTDGSAEHIKNQISKIKNTNQKLKIKLIGSKINVGFPSAVNKGVMEAKGEIVVLLNTDVYPKMGFLDAVLSHFADSQVFAVGMMDESIEENKIVRRGRGIGEWKRGLYVHQRGEVDKTDTAWVNGGSGAFRRSIFLKLGGFDPIYSPFYWEDIDLSYRAIKAGYRVIFEPKSVVVHEHDCGAILRHFTRKDITIISYRNQFIFVWRNATLMQLISHIVWLPYHACINLWHGNGNFFRGFWRAIHMINNEQDQQLKKDNAAFDKTGK